MQELISSERFGKLVRYAVKRFNMRLPIPFEDFQQEVALYLLKHPYTGSNVKDTTIIVKATRWTYKRLIESLMRKKRNSGKSFSPLVDNISYSNKDFLSMEDAEELNARLSLITKKQREIIQMMLDGEDVNGIIAKLGCAKQNVHSIKDRAIKKINEERQSC
jgi:RNA polymerase sigma factor (sigma-70 family)